MILTDFLCKSSSVSQTGFVELHITSPLRDTLSQMNVI